MHGSKSKFIVKAVKVRKQEEFWKESFKEDMRRLRDYTMYIQ